MSRSLSCDSSVLADFSCFLMDLPSHNFIRLRIQALDFLTGQFVSGKWAGKAGLRHWIWMDLPGIVMDKP